MSAETELRFAAALEKIAGAVQQQAETNDRLALAFSNMANRMDKLTATIQGAQRKIGGELGEVAERGQQLNRKLQDELNEIRRNRGNA